MKKFFYFLTFTLFVLIPLSSFAQVQGPTPSGATLDTRGQNLGYTPLEPIPGITQGSNGEQLDFPHLLGNIYKIAIIIGALFSVLMLTISGIQYMVSDIVSSKERSKKRIMACLYGLVLIAASYLILNTINPQLVTFTLNPGAATINTPSNNGGSNNPPPESTKTYTPQEAQQIIQSLNINKTNCDAMTNLLNSHYTSWTQIGFDIANDARSFTYWLFGQNIGNVADTVRMERGFVDACNNVQAGAAGI